MKSRTLALVLPLALGGLLSLGVACSDDDGDDGVVVGTPTTEVEGTEPPENGEANDRDEFIDTIEAQIDQIETQVDELETEIDSMTGDEQEAAQVRLDDLKATLEDLESRLDDLGSASDADYESLKADIEEQVERAMTEVQNFADELGI